MKKIILAAMTAGVIGLGFASMPAEAALRIGIGPHGVHVGVGPGHRCKMVQVWRHGHPAGWARRCW